MSESTPFLKIEALSMAINAVKDTFIKDITVKDGIIEKASNLLLKELKNLEKE